MVRWLADHFGKDWHARMIGRHFCSFLALVLRKELQERAARHGHRFEWADILRDFEALTETEVTHEGKRCATLRGSGDLP